MFDFRIGREGEGPKQCLGSFEGLRQTDGYKGYNHVGGPKMVHAFCLAHARRKYPSRKNRRLHGDHPGLWQGPYPRLALKFLGKTSIFLYTEALGQRDWHGRTAILVDEHTAGAAEMVAQFAQENSLATIVGMKTPGRLVTGRASNLGFGYRLVIPIAAYVSAKGTQIEGNEISSHIPIPRSFEDVAPGVDRQLLAAVDALRAA